MTFKLKFIVSSAAASLALLLSFPLAAQQFQGFYAEGGYSQFTVKTAGISADAPGLRLAVGYAPIHNLAVEGMLAYGIGDESKNIGPTKVTVKLQETLGLYLRPFVDVSENLQVYGRLGMTYSKVSATASNAFASVSTTQTGGDSSFGVGLALKTADYVYLTVDYMRYGSKDSSELTGLGIGLRVDF